MQLKHESLRGALALATCTVLSGTAHAQTPQPGDWKINSSMLLYSETDRVSVVEPAVFLTNTLAEEETLTLRLVFDSLTGASPTGASPTDRAQTFTSPSGEEVYTIARADLPMRNFRDQRAALGVDWVKRVSPLTQRTLSGNVSQERDYLSLGGNVGWARDFNQRLTTLGFGLGVSLDQVRPEGGAPVGLEQVQAYAASEADLVMNPDSRDGSSESKQTVDVLIGLTQVLSRRSLIQMNLSHSRTDGYLTDPYKMLSVIDGTSGATEDYVYEKRPDTRDANIFYGKFVHRFDRDVVHLSYRYFQDDWDVKAQTAELHYRYKMGDSYIEPQLRYHQQTAANFYRHSLVTGDAVDFASADMRLGEMNASTVGVKLGTRAWGGDMSLRLARMRQVGESHPDDAIGVQREMDLYPTLEAFIVTFGYSRIW